jgi:hypothetical protein
LPRQRETQDSTGQDTGRDRATRVFQRGCRAHTPLAEGAQRKKQRRNEPGMMAILQGESSSDGDTDCATVGRGPTWTMID